MDLENLIQDLQKTQRIYSWYKWENVSKIIQTRQRTKKVIKIEEADNDFTLGQTTQIRKKIVDRVRQIAADAVIELQTIEKYKSFKSGISYDHCSGSGNR